MGRHGDGEDKWDFSGNIDDVRIYGAALTDAQIGALFDGGL